MKANKKLQMSFFNEAVALVVENGQASISLLQRRLHIGYTRAARLIDQMEDRGYVGGYEGTKPREILITREQFQELFRRLMSSFGDCYTI